MTDYDDEKNVNFEMTLPAPSNVALSLGREHAPLQPDQLAAAEAADLVLRSEVVAPPSAPPGIHEVGLRAESPSELHLKTHLPNNKFFDGSELKQKPARRRCDSEK
eukprot:10947810-Heterocapsa_arctica.AAC.1